MTEIDSPPDGLTADQFAEAVKALKLLRMAIDGAQSSRTNADVLLEAIRRPTLSYTRDYLDESLHDVMRELSDINDAIARFEEDE